MKVLIVEDELLIAEAIAQVLKKNNYIVDLAGDGEYGLDCGLTAIYDIIILDIMLPKMNGLDVLKTFRKNDIQTPVILLTAKGDIEDKIIGLDSGADDYLAKPFHTKELLARMRAVSRRRHEIYETEYLTFGDLSLHMNELKLQNIEKETRITLKEAQLLEYLIKRHLTVTSKEQIIEKLWGINANVSDSHVEVHISFLRKKMKYVNSNVCIETIRGVGYRLVSIGGTKHV